MFVVVIVVLFSVQVLKLKKKMIQAFLTFAEDVGRTHIF